MIQDKIFFDEKDPTGLSYNTPFTYYGSYQGRLWSKSPTGSIKYYTQNSDLSAYATTGSNQFSGSQTITGSLTVTGTITGTVAGTTATASYVEYTNVANKPALVSGSSQVTYSGLTGVPSGIVSGSAQVASFGIFATTGSNGFNGSQSITGSLTVTGQVVAQTLNVQQVTSSIVYSSGSNVFGNSLANTQQFTGSVGVTGSLSVNGASSFSSNVTATGNLNLQGAVTRNINFYDSSNTNINAQIQYDQISSTSGQLFFGTNNAGTFATRLTISNTGAATFSNNVGINGVSPTYPLYVRTGTNQRARFVDNGGLFQFGVLNDAEGAYSDMSLGNSAIMIKSSGNVGIGTTSPDVTGFGWRTLTIKGGTASGEAGVLELQSPTTTGAANLGIIAFLDGSNRNAQIGGVRDGANNSGALSFVTWNAGTGAERFRIASTGAATFSSSVQTNRIKLVESTYGTNYTIYTGVDNTNSIGIYNETSGVYNIKIASTGAATFGSSVTATRFVSSTGIFGFFNNSINTFSWEIGSDASVGAGMYIYNPSGGYALTLSSAGVLSTLGGGTSDRRTKEDIKYINESALPFINELNPVSFKFINDISKKIRRGFIAQEVLETSIPSLVLGNGEKEGGIYGLDYDGILALAIKATQELSAKIETLEAKIQTLEQQ